MIDLDGALAARKRAIETELDRRFPEPPEDPGRLMEALRYSLLGPGKRLRGCIVTWACEAVGGSVEDALAAACAIECLHTYTLVHDDLPAMDDDDERRGRPTSHKVFGEATAILTGDALLTEAFGLLPEVRDPEAALFCVRALAAAGGTSGVILGQVRDLLLEGGGEVSMADLERVHAEKTGALFAAAAQMGGACGGADGATLSALGDYGRLLGIAFQHADDLDDADRPEQAAAARRRLAELVAKAKARLGGLTDGPAKALLAALAERTAARHLS
ncbi:MAG: polyprenyl synthetase family protein [Deltaproteobacteria bacterium]|nr:polyprenyl synthetase family protein [Deltaproteobacteria bacterium]